VSVIATATATNTVTDVIDIGLSQDAVAITPDGRYAYVANADANSVSVIKTTANEVIATIPVGSNPCALAFSSDGKTVHTANYNGAD